MVLESLTDEGEGRDETWAPAACGHPYFDAKAQDRWGQWDAIRAGDDDDDYESLNDGSS